MMNTTDGKSPFLDLLVHTCRVYGMVAEGESGKSLQFHTIQKYEQLPCRISGATGSAPSADGISASHTSSVKIFFEAGVVIAPGDLLHVSALGEILTLEAIFFHAYENHVEVSARSLWEGSYE